MTLLDRYKSSWTVSTVLAVATIATLFAVVACGPPVRPPAAEQSAKVRSESSHEKLVARGKAFAQVGDLIRAEQYLSSALDHGADPDDVMPLLLRVCFQSGHFRTFIDRAQEYLITHPNNVPLRFLLGSLLIEVAHDYGAARDHLERVVADDPTHAEAHYALAVVAREQLDLVRADRHCREYLRLSPDGPFADDARSSLLESVP